MKKKYPTALPFLPEQITVPNLKEASEGCKGCDLYKYATQTVFGEGRKSSQILFVGEQPGDKEDIQGQPFVGPAGVLLDRALLEAGIDRKDTYVTNAVKHFKFEERGKRRLHKKPSIGQINACKPWLISEISVVKPKIIVCLGATAALSILGKDFKLMKKRGKIVNNELGRVMATVHPSALLRIQDEKDRKLQFARFVKDLKSAKEFSG